MNEQAVLQMISDGRVNEALEIVMDEYDAVLMRHAIYWANTYNLSVPPREAVDEVYLKFLDKEYKKVQTSILGFLNSMVRSHYSAIRRSAKARDMEKIIGDIPPDFPSVFSIDRIIEDGTTEEEITTSVVEALIGNRKHLLAFILRHRYCLSYEQIAEELHMTPASVQVTNTISAKRVREYITKGEPQKKEKFPGWVRIFFSEDIAVIHTDSDFFIIGFEEYLREFLDRIQEINIEWQDTEDGREVLLLGSGNEILVFIMKE